MRKLDSDDVAVFSRNHRIYLETAEKIGTREPSERVVFRARARWATRSAGGESGGGEMACSCSPFHRFGGVVGSAREDAVRDAQLPEA